MPTAKQPGAPKLRRGGRNGSQPVYTQAIADEICDRLAEGEPLNQICKTPGMPCFKAVLNWVHNDERAPGFGQRYARARSIGYERIAEEVLTISDSRCTGPNGYVDNAAVQRARLMVESRKWLLSKMLPKIYGDKIELSGDASAPLIQRIELVAVRPKLTPPTIDDE